jgi:lipopolysaccharide/colanic/teichoic acid biosynthesis glycosyltransferase
MIYRRFGKRLVDIIFSGLGLIFLSPVFLMLAILVTVKLGRPVYFVQVRPGFQAKPFNMVKFRSMKDLRYADGKYLPDDIRLTPFGQFLRATSLDELPELWNVLKGDMSLVGPRPLLLEYVPLYSEYQFRRHEVKPGITGLAQINGRNDLSWNDKFKFDIHYIDNISFMGDLKIIFKTFFKVMIKEGISHSSGSNEPFTGNNKE